MKKIGLAFLTMSFFLLLSGCNTMKGLGEDISEGGKALGSIAEDVQKKM
ncbi:MAG: hypothetical protein IJ022_02375 [Burkholderiaceae bacterium]|nr:hypothetical protein [Burkholderiaceae bacterium]